MSQPSLKKPAHEYGNDELQNTTLFGVGVLPVRSSRGSGAGWEWGGCCCTGCGSSQAKSIHK